jgi:hypothetical protein
VRIDVETTALLRRVLAVAAVVAVAVTATIAIVVWLVVR